MCKDYTIKLPKKRILTIDAIKLIVDEMRSSKEFDIPAKITLGGIDILIQGDSNPSQLFIGYQYKKLKMQKKSIIPSDSLIGACIGPYISSELMDVFIDGILYYGTDKNSAEYNSVSKKYENSINRLAISE